MVDSGFYAQLQSTKDYKIDISCFSAEHEALRSRTKTGIMCPSVYPRSVVSVSWHYKNPTKCVGLLQSRHIISSIEK